MTDAHEPRADSETEVIPAVRSGEHIASTRELPVVQDETVVTPPPGPPPARDETAVTPPPVQDETVVTPPPVQARPRPSPAAVSTPQSPPAAVRPAAPAPARRGAAWRNAFLALVALLVVAIGVGVVVTRSGGDSGGPARGGNGGAVAVDAAISSFDPSGGSGFRKESGSTWRTQTYRTAEFGNLKDGVGLLLDLGSAREVTTASFDVVGGPIAVELRAGDEQTSAGGYRTVASAGSASGPTTLTPKDAGKHRYWLVWVTRLAPQDGGYRAVIRDPAIKARPN